MPVWLTLTKGGTTPLTGARIYLPHHSLLTHYLSRGPCTLRALYKEMENEKEKEEWKKVKSPLEYCGLRLIGFVTSGQLSLSTGRCEALAFVSLTRLALHMREKEYQIKTEEKLLLRNVSSPFLHIVDARFPDWALHWALNPPSSLSTQ